MKINLGSPPTPLFLNRGGLSFPQGTSQSHRAAKKLPVAPDYPTDRSPWLRSVVTIAPLFNRSAPVTVLQKPLSFRWHSSDLLRCLIQSHCRAGNYHCQIPNFQHGSSGAFAACRRHKKSFRQTANLSGARFRVCFLLNRPLFQDKYVL